MRSCTKEVQFRLVSIRATARMIKHLQWAVKSLPGATKADKPRFGMARQMAMTPLVNPILGEVAIYTIVASLAFTTVSIVLALVLATCHATSLIIANAV